MVPFFSNFGYFFLLVGNLLLPEVRLSSIGRQACLNVIHHTTLFVKQIVNGLFTLFQLFLYVQSLRSLFCEVDCLLHKVASQSLKLNCQGLNFTFLVLKLLIRFLGQLDFRLLLLLFQLTQS